MNGTLTPDGARLLRAARDQILAHPDTFNMREWDCGTTACIAGHCLRLLSAPERVTWGIDSLETVYRALGFHFHVNTWMQSPLNRDLFSLDYVPSADIARAEINRFLWSYGYPPEEMASPSDAPEAVNAVAGTGDVL